MYTVEALKSTNFRITFACPSLSSSNWGQNLTYSHQRSDHGTRDEIEKEI
jgi:hypothetical protein